jgi:hypothetical protein
LNDEGLIKVCDLGNGVTATVTDLTRHYFGGYYHVRIEISADIALTAEQFESGSEFENAVERLGRVITFTRILDKMAVPESEIESVRRDLVCAFDANLLPYLLRDSFIPGFVRSEYHKKMKSVPLFSGKYT